MNACDHLRCLKPIDLVWMVDIYRQQPLYAYHQSLDRMAQHLDMAFYILRVYHRILYAGKLPT